MPWELLNWLVAFLLQASKMGLWGSTNAGCCGLQATAATSASAATAASGSPSLPADPSLPLLCPQPHLQSALLGCCMYQLIQLSDLECDFINPHDAARNINWVVVSPGG